MELDKTAIELDNSRIVASGNSKESQDTPMGDTEECQVQLVRVQKLKQGEEDSNPNDLINSPTHEQKRLTPNTSNKKVGKGNREPTKEEIFQLLGEDGGRDGSNSKSFVKKSEKKLQESLLLTKTHTESSELVEHQSPDRRRKSAMIFKRDRENSTNDGIEQKKSPKFGTGKPKQTKNQMSYLMNLHSQEFPQTQNNLLTAHLQDNYFSASSNQNDIDKLEVKDVDLRPAKKLLLTPGNDLKDHQ